MTGLIEENWKVIGLTNTLLKDIKRTRIVWTIKSIITHKIWTTIELICWPLMSNICPWYVLLLVMAEEIDLESLRGCWPLPLLTKYWPSGLASVMITGVIGIVVPGTGGNGTNLEVEVTLKLLIFSWTELTIEVLITAHPCSLRVNPYGGVPPSNHPEAVFFWVNYSRWSW